MLHNSKQILAGLSRLFFFACSKNSPAPVPTPATYYYPPLSGTASETINAADLGWKMDKLDELLRYVDSNNSSAFIILYKGRIVTEHRWFPDRSGPGAGETGSQ